MRGSNLPCRDWWFLWALLVPYKDIKTTHKKDDTSCIVSQSLIRDAIDFLSELAILVCNQYQKQFVWLSLPGVPQTPPSVAYPPPRTTPTWIGSPSKPFSWWWIRLLWSICTVNSTPVMPPKPPPIPSAAYQVSSHHCQSPQMGREEGSSGNRAITPFTSHVFWLHLVLIFDYHFWPTNPRKFRCQYIKSSNNTSLYSQFQVIELVFLLFPKKTPTRAERLWIIIDYTATLWPVSLKLQNHWLYILKLDHNPKFGSIG